LPAPKKSGSKRRPRPSTGAARWSRRDGECRDPRTVCPVTGDNARNPGAAKRPRHSGPQTRPSTEMGRAAVGGQRDELTVPNLWAPARPLNAGSPKTPWRHIEIQLEFRVFLRSGSVSGGIAGPRRWFGMGRCAGGPRGCTGGERQLHSAQRPPGQVLSIWPCRRGQAPQSQSGRNHIDNPNAEHNHWGKP
jgi:hypothetical protein